MRLGVVAALFLSVVSLPVRAADDPTTIVDKAIKALGGEEALAKVKAFSWKGKSMLIFQGNENQATGQVTAEGLTHYRQEFQGEFNGNNTSFLLLLNGDKASRTFNGNTADLDKEGVANQKRGVYLSVIPITILPLRSKDYKLESIAEEKVGDKPAVGLKVMPPDGKEFKLYFDKESGVPVKLVARVVGFQNMEYTQETTFADYKDMAGIKKATRIESKRDGEVFQKIEVTEFKVLDKVDAKIFGE